MNRTMLVIALLLLSPLGMAGTSRVDVRQDRQHARIEQGVACGALTPREAGRLRAQQVRISRREARFKSDGVLSRGERLRLQRSLNRAHRNIRRHKHNLRCVH